MKQKLCSWPSILWQPYKCIWPAPDNSFHKGANKGISQLNSFLYKFRFAAYFTLYYIGKFVYSIRRTLVHSISRILYIGHELFQVLNFSFLAMIYDVI